jgi:ABC-type antimicrobial peptide transport system permease subunit
MINNTERSMVYVQAGGVAKIGIGFGTALAIAISWSVNKSIAWAIVHGLLSWAYVIYYAITTHGP